jgi:hypothetical protein
MRVSWAFACRTVSGAHADGVSSRACKTARVLCLGVSQGWRSPLLAASLSGHGSATSGIAAWPRLLTESWGSTAAITDRDSRLKLTVRDSVRDGRQLSRGSAVRGEEPPGRLKYPPIWRGSGCALSVMAAAQIRRFCMPATQRSPLLPRVLMPGGQHHQPNPADLARQLGQRTRNGPPW